MVTTVNSAHLFFKFFWLNTSIFVFLKFQGAEETVKLKVDTVDIEVEANKKIFLKAPDADKTGSVVEIVDLKKDKTLTLTSYGTYLAFLKIQQEFSMQDL